MPSVMACTSANGGGLLRWHRARALREQPLPVDLAPRGAETYEHRRAAFRREGEREVGRRERVAHADVDAAKILEFRRAPLRKIAGHERAQLFRRVHFFVEIAAQDRDGPVEQRNYAGLIVGLVSR